ncbi:hypothetical protein BD410DRAFT_892515 [Rickenella mellea]|uniref:Uncharacterized protein n=1 Tax=Rickenella mellea TaxID=50990 RepID=A0A4R5XDM4_9AGAM|nr:hypothetical protein BD410DRAFT_892515 [Rickenella mellea]
MDWFGQDSHTSAHSYTLVDDIDEDDDPSQLTPLGDARNQLDTDSTATSNKNFLSRLKDNLTAFPIANMFNNIPAQNFIRHRGVSEQSHLPVSSQVNIPYSRFSEMSVRRLYEPELDDRNIYDNMESVAQSVTSSQSSALSSENAHIRARYTPSSPNVSTNKPASSIHHSQLPSISDSSQSTPPLTPDLLSDSQSFPSAYSATDGPKSPRERALRIKGDAEKEENGILSSKGKKPAPPLPYETLIADAYTDTVDGAAEDVATEELREWHGLQYALDLSRRQRSNSSTSMSTMSSSTTGEHSKSRESWAAIHQGSVHPFYEDKEFLEWKRWHRHLERAEKRMRRRRILEFEHDAHRKANLFVDEIYGRQAVQLFHDKLSPKEYMDALEWVIYASEELGDPYIPAEKHNLAWVLKKHRSIASIRELYGSSCSSMQLSSSP